VLAVIYFFAIFYYRNKFNAKKVDTAKRKKELAPMVSEFLFYQENEGTIEEKNSYINQKIEIRELIKDQKNKTVLSEILLDLQKDVSGETRKRLFSLYKVLNLKQEAFNKLKSYKWQKISQGMFELTQMQVTESYGFISRFINDKRSVVRKQAEISTVTLMHEGISYFLDTTKYQISEWQQLKILEVLSNLDGFQPPKFNKWLTSTNRDVVLFSLRLISHYDQNDTEKSIISLVRHKNNHIKNEAINCIKKFYFESSRHILKTVFWSNNVRIKLAILDTLADFGNLDDIPFLEKVDKKEFNFTVRSKALSAINTIHPEYVMPSVDLEEIVEDLPEVQLTNENSIEEVIAETQDVILPANLEEINREIENIDGDSSEKLIHQEKTIGVNHIESVKNGIQVFSEKEKHQIDIETITEEQFLKHKNIPDDPIINTEGASTELSASYQSIFKSLFDSSDDYCKLLLLDEILEIGNIKEILFLASLHNYHNTEIRKKALLIKDKLQSKLGAEIHPEAIFVEDLEFIEKDPKSESFDFTEEVFITNFPTMENESNANEPEIPDGLEPLEFCFLLEELEIEPAKEFDVFDIEFDLELSSERTNPIENATAEVINISKEQLGLSEEEHTFFQKLLEFPSTINNIFNG
tara:strand:+ start:233775 stop:235691 length:1917 start_codon:yes stop_codon:yes gene_type:complete